MDSRRTALRLLWPVALLALGALVLASAWGRWPISLLFAGAAAAPLLLLRGALRLGVSRWASTSLLVLLAVMGAYLATTGAALSLEQTVRDAVPRLLTSPQPYGVRPDLLVGPVLLTVFVSLLVGLRLDSRTRVEPLIGCSVLYVAGALLTDGRADPWGLVVVLILVVTLLGWVLLDEHSEPARRRLAIAGPVAVVGVGVLAGLATLPLSQPFSPRSLVEPPRIEVSARNPLPQLGAWATNPDVELLRVRGDRVPLRLIALDEYDGTQWTSSTSYEALNSDGTTDFAPGAYPTSSALEIEITGLGGNWLPSPGTPLQVGLPDALVDPATGTLLAPDDPAGVAYEVAGTFDDPPPSALESAAVADGAISDRYTQLPPLPNDLATYAARVAARAVTPYERAVAIESQLRDTYTLSDTAISGSALWRLSDFLLGPTSNPGGQVGTSEQFATAFAVLARFNGLPTRVVVGFRPGEDLDDGARVVRGRDAFAWAEVYFGDLGWVPFSPTPDDDTFVRPQPVAANSPDLPTFAPTETPSATPSTPAETPADASETSDPDATTSGASVVVLALTALVSGLLLLLALRLVRRLRHRGRGAVGAWAEVVDAMRLAGAPAPSHVPADVLAAATDARLGTSGAVLVAEQAERAAFGPGDDRGRSPAADESGLHTHVRAIRRGSRRAVPWWRRWWWHLDPRVLRRR